MGLRQLDKITEETAKTLQSPLKHESASVQMIAAETLSHFNYTIGTMEVLEKWLQVQRPRLSLMVATNLLLVEKNAKPAIHAMYQVLEKNLSEPGIPMKI